MVMAPSFTEVTHTFAKITTTYMVSMVCIALWGCEVIIHYNWGFCRVSLFFLKMLCYLGLVTCDM